MDIGSILLTLVVALGMVLIGAMALLPTWFDIASRRQDVGAGAPAEPPTPRRHHSFGHRHRSRV